MLAQSLGEYSAQARPAAGAQQLTDSFRDWISNAGPTTWLAVGAVVVALWFFNRRPSRF